MSGCAVYRYRYTWPDTFTFTLWENTDPECTVQGGAGRPVRRPSEAMHSALMTGLRACVLLFGIGATLAQDYQLQCSSIVDLRSRSACEHLAAPGKRDRHMARMVKCASKWRTLPESAYRIYLLGTSVDYRKAIDRVWDERWPTTASLQICELVEPDPDLPPTSFGTSGTWLFFKLGSFDTTGGSTWSRMMLTLSPELTARFEDSNGELSIGDHILGATLADGDLLNDPPLHQHHFHFFFESNPWRQVLNVHGDSECFGNQGTYCLLKEYPEGIAFHTRPELGIAADMIDVRPANAERLPWYAFAGIQLRSPGASRQPLTRPIRQSYINVSPNIGMEIADDVTDVFQTFQAHSGRVVWSTGVIPDIDYVLDAYFHVHREMLEDMWIFEGGGAELGLWDSPWVDAFMRTLGPEPRAVERLGAVAAGREHLDRLKDHLRARITHHGAKLLCRHSDFVAHREYDVGTQSMGAVQPSVGAGPRSIGDDDAHDFIGGRVICPLSKAGLKGDVRWTAVVFQSPQISTAPDPYPMHTLVRVYHTTQSNISDKDLRWRTPPCNLTERWSIDGPLNAGILLYSCGEEYYFPVDNDFLYNAFNIFLYPHLSLFGLRLLHHFGLSAAVKVFTQDNSGVPASVLYGGATLLLVLTLWGSSAILRCCTRAVRHCAQPSQVSCEYEQARQGVAIKQRWGAREGARGFSKRSPPGVCAVVDDEVLE